MPSPLYLHGGFCGNEGRQEKQPAQYASISSKTSHFLSVISVIPKGGVHVPERKLGKNQPINNEYFILPTNRVKLA